MQDIRRGKPDPEVFLVAAERLGIRPAQCVVVEDAIPGVEAAKAGGFKCIAVTTTNDAEVLREKAAPDLVLAATADVTPAVVGNLLTK
jgi:beta-phosphoglucomutase-like phosphatase (HAD superfamily)